MTKKSIITFLLGLSVSISYSQTESYPDLPGDYFDQWEDCGIDRGTIRGGQYSAETLNKMCAENKARRRNRIILFSSIGLLTLILLYKVTKKGKQAIDRGIKHQSLAMNFNGLYLLINQIKQNKDYSDIKNNLIHASLIAKIEIIDFIEESGKKMSEPIIVPAISKSKVSVQHALDLTVRDIYALAEQFDLQEPVEDIFNEGPLFQQHLAEYRRARNKV